MKLTSKHIIVALFLSITAMLTVNSVLFWHTHQLRDGSIVVHAHPFNKQSDSSPLKTHHHTKSALLFLELVKILFVFSILTSLSFVLYKIQKQLFRYIVLQSQKQQIVASGRAPPHHS